MMKRKIKDKIRQVQQEESIDYGSLESSKLQKQSWYSRHKDNYNHLSDQELMEEYVRNKKKYIKHKMKQEL